MIADHDVLSTSGPDTGRPDWAVNPRLVLDGSNHLVSEEYRKLKSLLIQLMGSAPGQNLIGVTSSIGGEGKSLTALNLALALAQEHDRRTLIMDADLRKPSIANYLGTPGKKGVAQYLEGNAGLDELLVPAGVGNLTLLPAGEFNRNPVEYFSSRRMKELLLQLKERFHDGYIVVDSSPVLPFAESRILARLVDGVVYVVREGRTTLGNIETGLESLSQCNLLGLVYNGATPAGLGGSYHFYYDKYRYRYDREPNGTQTGSPPAGLVEGARETAARKGTA